MKGVERFHEWSECLELGVPLPNVAESLSTLSISASAQPDEGEEKEDGLEKSTMFTRGNG